MTGADAIAIVARRLDEAERLYDAVLRSSHGQAAARLNAVIATLTEVLTELRQREEGVDLALAADAQALLRGDELA